MLVPDYNAKHRLYSQARARRLPLKLRPTTWVLGAIVVVAAATDLLSLSFRAVN